MAEILHFEILRKHGQTNTHTNKQTHTHTHTHTQTNTQTWALQYLPPPMGGEVNITLILDVFIGIIFVF